MSKLFESVLEKNTSIIDKIGQTFGELASAIRDLSSVVLREETKQGKVQYNKTISICLRLKKLIDELNYKIEHDILVDQKSAKDWAKSIDFGDTPDVLSIQKRVLSAEMSDVYDDDDRSLTIRACQMYGQLLSMYRSAVHKYNVKHADKKIMMPQNVSFKKSKYSVSDEEVRQELTRIYDENKSLV